MWGLYINWNEKITMVAGVTSVLFWHTKHFRNIVARNFIDESKLLVHENFYLLQIIDIVPYVFDFAWWLEGVFSKELATVMYSIQLCKDFATDYKEVENYKLLMGAKYIKLREMKKITGLIFCMESNRMFNRGEVIDRFQKLKNKVYTSSEICKAMAFIDENIFSKSSVLQYINKWTKRKQ